MLKRTFEGAIEDAESLCAVFQHCEYELRLPVDNSDLLRMAVVYSLSALDRLIHDLVTYYMIEVFAGRRAPTPKYLSEALSFQDHNSLVSALTASYASAGVGQSPPAESIFEGVVRRKIGHLSFMDPIKMADALALVWEEKNKWGVIAQAMGSDERSVRTELKNLHTRRNSIVHEADRMPPSHNKTVITLVDAERCISFIRRLGEAILQKI
jgi:hypothetical protein